jgi:hypothetical protein
MTDISKGEDTLRHIAEINKHPMSPNAKIRPVQIIIVYYLWNNLHYLHTL